jgi:hypothetical protein
MANYTYLIPVIISAIGSIAVRGKKPPEGRYFSIIFSLTATLSCLLFFLIKLSISSFANGIYNDEYFANGIFNDEYLVALLASLLCTLNVISTPRTNFLSSPNSTNISLVLLLQALGIASCFSNDLKTLSFLLILESIVFYLGNIPPPKAFWLIPAFTFLIILFGFLGLDDRAFRLLILIPTFCRLGIFPFHSMAAKIAHNSGLSVSIPFLLSPIPFKLLINNGFQPDISPFFSEAVVLLSLTSLLYFAFLNLALSDARSYWCYLVFAINSTILLGFSQNDDLSKIGALNFYFGVWVSLTGSGLVLRGLESRYGRLDLRQYHGLYRSSPVLGFSFLMFGISNTAFPGFATFIPLEILIDGILETSWLQGGLLMLSLAIISVTSLQIYFKLFIGNRESSPKIFKIKKREIIMICILLFLSTFGSLLILADLTNFDHYHPAQEVKKPLPEH